MICILSFLLIYAVMFFIGLIPAPGFMRQWFGDGNDNNSISDSIKIIEESYPTDVIIYGDDITFETKIQYRKVDSLGGTALERISGFQYTYLVINDLEDKLTLTKLEITAIKEFVNKSGNGLAYFGTKYLTSFDDVTKLSADIKGNKAVAYNNIGGNVKKRIGFWTDREEEIKKDNPYIQSELLMYTIEDFLRSNN